MAMPDITALKTKEKLGNLHRNYKYGKGTKSTPLSIIWLKPVICVPSSFKCNTWIMGKLNVE